MLGSNTRLREHIPAPRSAVYEALIDPAAVAIWMVPDGMTSRVHQFESREGGRFRISLTYEEPSAVGKTTAHTDTYHGYFAELVPDEKVVQVITFESDDPQMLGEMTVTMTLADEGDGTQLLAEHANVPPGIRPEDNELGWRLALDKLSRLLSGHRREV